MTTSLFNDASNTPTSLNSPSDLKQTHQSPLFSPSFYSIIPPKPKIPKRPLFQPIRIDYENRIPRIRVKAWKTLKCRIIDVVSNRASGCVVYHLERKEASAYFCSPTFRKCLKHVKDLAIWQTPIGKELSVHKLRPEKLFISQDLDIASAKCLLKRLVHSQSLKSLVVDNQCKTPDYYWKLLSVFPKIQSLYYLQDRYSKSKSNFPTNYLRRPRLSKLRTLCVSEDQMIDLSDFSVISWFKQLQHLTFTSLKSPKDWIISQLKQLNHLVSLRLELPYEYGDPPEIDFNFEVFAEYKRIEVLHLSLSRDFKEQSWNTILQLPSLKDFAFICSHKKYTPSLSQEALPSFLHLQKLTVNLDAINPDFLDFYCAVLSRIQVSETLTLSSTSEGLLKFLNGNFSLPLKNLRLRDSGTKDPEGSEKLSRGIMKFLNQQPLLRFLVLHIDKWRPHALNYLFKVMENLTCLESLAFSLPRSFRLEKKEFENFQKVIKTHRMRLRTLSLDGFLLTSIELSGLISTFKAVRYLENLSLNLNLPYVYDAAIRNFTRFLSSAKQVKSLQVDIISS